MTSKNIESASRALSAIDVRSHVAAISEATAAQQRFANAVEDGRQRITALNIEIREALNQEVTDPASAGDALLAGVEPDAVDVEKLRATKRSIEAGMTDLRNRRTELSDTIRRERSEAISALAAASAPLLDEAREMARQAAVMLAQAHAVAEATRLKAGDTFSFSTVYDVLMNNYIVIPKGTRGQGKVTWRTGKGAFGKSAKMDLSFDWIDIGGRRIIIEGKHRQEGSGNTAATVGTAVAVGPFAAFVTGKSATVPNGMHLKAFTAEPIQFQVAGLVAAPQQAQVIPVSSTGAVVTQGTSPAVSAVSSGDKSQ